MSEGTPGRGPDADPRTGTGDGQAPTNGRPAVPPVRYGPRGGGPANGRGTTGRTVPGTGSPQQYRAPQPPRTPAKDGSGTGAGGAGKNGANGSGSNGSHPATPVSYTRSRPAGPAGRPDPSEQDRLVAEARIAAAARNASAAKVRGGSSPSGRTQAGGEQRSSTTTSDPRTSAAPVDETTVIPAVEPQDESPETATSDVASGGQTPSADRSRSMFGRLRGSRSGRSPQAVDAPTTLAAPVVAASPAEAPTTESPKAETPSGRSSELAAAQTGEQADEPQPGSEKAVASTEQDAATEQRPLTWRDRIGLPPKERKAEPGDAAATTAASTSATTSTDAVLPTAAAATVLTGSTPTALAPLPGRITPSAPMTTSDTVVIPAVDAATGAPTPVAGSTALPVVAPKAKVGAARRTRKARLRLSRLDPWSVMKTALLFSIAGGIILVVATYGVWSVLNASGLFASVNDMVKSVVSTPGDTTPFRIEEYVNTQKIIGVAALIAVVDVLIFTALATLGSFLYNLAATVLGGLEVTLAED